MKKSSTPMRTIELSQVLDRYWDLANLDPEVTKGSITGQLKALDSLCDELAAVEGRTPRPLRPSGLYRPPWLDGAPAGEDRPTPRGREN